MLHAPNHASFTQNSTWPRSHSNNGITLAFITKPGQWTSNSIKTLQLPELANSLEHALGWTTASIPTSRKGLSWICACAHGCTFTSTHVCYPALPQADTILTSSHYVRVREEHLSELKSIGPVSFSSYSLAQGSEVWLFNWSTKSHILPSFHWNSQNQLHRCWWMPGTEKQPEVSTWSAQAYSKNLRAMSLSSVKYLIFLAFR